MAVVVARAHGRSGELAGGRRGTSRSCSGAVPDDVLARVFGVIQMLWRASDRNRRRAGAGYSSRGWGSRRALIAVPARSCRRSSSCSWGRRSARIDAAAACPRGRTVQAARPGDGTDLRAAAGRLARAPGGAARASAVSTRARSIVREGDAGDRFWHRRGGGDGGVAVRTAASRRARAPGGYFGEIALLRDVPRTATVTARTDAVLYALDRDDFLAAVTGHPGRAPRPRRR